MAVNLLARTMMPHQYVRRTWWALVLTARRRVATPCRSSAEHAATKLFRDRPFVDQKIQRRPPKTALEQRLGNRRQFDKTPVRPEHAVGGKHVHVRMKVHQVADGSEPP